jgi:hypothetical protein
MKGKLQKLRHVGIDELRVRGSQFVAAFAERHGLSSRAKLMSNTAFLELLSFERVALRSPLELRDYFRNRVGPKFFPAFDNPAGTVSEFKKRWPDVATELVQRANGITANHFDLLGLRQLSFGVPIDWHLEPLAGKRAPLVHWSRLNYLDSERFGDKKITWELNRHQYFATLGQAYWLTGDERYAQTFSAHINSWCAENPPKLGINWASSLEVAFRSISWLWALHFFRHSSALTPEIFSTIAKFLYINALHLETYLSTYFSPNTHLTGEALGLFYLGTMLPEFKEAERWRRTGLRILVEQLERHVQADGAYFEQSTYYHRYTTDFYLHLRILLAANNQGLPQQLDGKLQQLLDFLMYVKRPDGRTPMVGDDDGGRLVTLDDRPANDFRATLSTGAAVFGRADYKFVADEPAEETLWLLGAEGLAKLDQLMAREPARQSIGFEDSGYYVLRDSWAPEANYMFFDCGHHGADNCGHAHADALSFELAVHGRTLLIDPGTYTYTASKEMRDSFRSSAAHNTLVVDDESWSIPAGPFSWNTIGNCRISSWISKDRFDYVAANQDRPHGYSAGLTHWREVLFLKDDYWVIRDRIGSFGNHNIKLWFHFDSSVAPLRGKDQTIRVISENGHSTGLQLATFAERGEWIRESGWVSHCYGVKDEGPVCVYSVHSNGPAELITFLVPETSGAGPKPVVREFEALNGRAFEVNVNDTHDVLLFPEREPLSESGQISTARFASNFDLAWIRFANERVRNPDEFVLLRGETVELDGRILLKSTRTIDYLVASSVGDRFRVETNEGELEISLPVLDLESLFADLNQTSAT